MMGRLVFVMGVQRSGTTALFRSLRGGAEQVYNEAHNSPLFEAMYLRPEPQVRQAISGAAGPVLVKPISETKRRSVQALWREYAHHDLRVAWIYRDPVNCYASHIQRWDEFKGDPDAFVEAWCQRNQMALDALASGYENLAIVRYRDLIDDPSVIKKLGNFLGIQGRYRFRADSDRGRSVLTKAVVERIQVGSQPVLEGLQDARSFESRSSRAWRRWLARIV